MREANVYSEVVPHTWSTEQILARDPAAIILSGGPASVYADDAPAVDPDLFEADVPVPDICYGFQAMARALGGTVEAKVPEVNRVVLDVTSKPPSTIEWE